MIKIIWGLKRKPGTTMEQFRNHYENSHVRLAQKYAGQYLLDYRRNYVVDSKIFKDRVEQDIPFGWDVITEMRVRDRASCDAMMKVFSEGETGKLFEEDELRFIDTASVLLVECEEVDTGPNGPY